MESDGIVFNCQRPGAGGHASAMGIGYRIIALPDKACDTFHMLTKSIIILIRFNLRMSYLFMMLNRRTHYGKENLAMVAIHPIKPNPS